ncbi:MAG: hypothetical protein ACYC75_03275 [Minisyncoccota bacterium]
MFPRFYSPFFTLSLALALGSFLVLGAPLTTQASFYPGQTTDPGCLPSDPTCVISSIASSTANSIPYYALNGSVLSATSTIQVLANGTASTTGAKLNGTTVVSGPVSPTHACATGFVRYSPNFCKSTDIGNSWASGMGNGVGNESVVPNYVLFATQIPTTAQAALLDCHLFDNGSGFATGTAVTERYTFYSDSGYVHAADEILRNFTAQSSTDVGPGANKEVVAPIVNGVIYYSVGATAPKTGVNGDCFPVAYWSQQ